MKIKEYITVKVHQYSAKKLTQLKIKIVKEHSINIFINGRQYSTIACSPANLEYLVMGHLYYEGLIKQSSDIKRINIDKDNRNCFIDTKNPLQADKDVINIISSGTVRNKGLIPGITASGGSVKVHADMIIEKANEFLNKSTLHQTTHGVHSACLYNVEGEELLFLDDIGRHNAIDKIIGFALKNNVDLSDKIIFLTGRLASEIVYKILNSSVPVLVSRATTTDVSYDLAKKYNLTMIGNAEKDKFFVFNGKNNIIF